MSDELRRHFSRVWLSAGPRFGEGVKAAVRARQGFVCAICGEADEGRKLSVHHIDGNRWNNSADNLIALCRRCHFEVHRDGVDCRRYQKDSS